MNIDAITPMILTFNEEDNIGETIGRLSWASKILVVDSFSTDGTIGIVGQFGNVHLVQNRFESFAAQCNFGLAQIQTEWVLSLDADYKCSKSMLDELDGLGEEPAGYFTRFQYGIFGSPLRSALYPPRIVLYKKNCAEYVNDGHAHRVRVMGQVGMLNTVILHDDRKPLSSWFRSQIRYAEQEAEKLTAASSKLGWKDRLRTWIVFAPILTLFYCLFAKRLVFDGWSGIYYSLQRSLAELVLSVTLIDRKLRIRSGKSLKRES